jgi:methylaspartate mutase sigma subunit
VRHTLREAGFKVVSLGALVSQEEFVKAAIETNAAAILVSSIYGQGRIDCQGFRDKLTEAGVRDILLYIGGNLAIGDYDFESVAQDYRRMGFDRAYPATTMPQVAIDDLKRDLGITTGGAAAATGQ